MITYFSEIETKNITLQKTSSNPLSELYLSEREKVWQTRLKQSQESGARLWNGEIYTLEKLIQYTDEHITLKLGTCEYKDILFRIHTRTQSNITIFPEAEILYLTVCCIPITTDNRCVFGIRSNQTAVQEGAIGLIGGTLNKDEKEIHKFDDFFTFMHHEIEEETAIESKNLSLNLFSLNSFRMKYEFLFTLKLPVHSRDIDSLHREGEFSKLVALDLNEVFNIQHPQTDSFRYLKNYLPHLLKTHTSGPQSIHLPSYPNV